MLALHHRSGVMKGSSLSPVGESGLFSFPFFSLWCSWWKAVMIYYLFIIYYLFCIWNMIHRNILLYFIWFLNIQTSNVIIDRWPYTIFNKKVHNSFKPMCTHKNKLYVSWAAILIYNLSVLSLYHLLLWCWPCEPIGAE